MDKVSEAREALTAAVNFYAPPAYQVKDEGAKALTAAMDALVKAASERAVEDYKSALAVEAAATAKATKPTKAVEAKPPKADTSESKKE